MTYGKLTDNQYLLRFEKGDDLLLTLIQFCAQHQITNSAISALGSIENPTLAHYRHDTKKYSEKKFEGIYEVVNLTGNVAMMDDKPLPHCHVTISDEEMQTYGGHLAHGTVSATLEMTLTSFPTSYIKKHNDEIGLNLWELPER